MFIALFSLLQALTLGQGWGFGDNRILALLAGVPIALGLSAPMAGALSDKFGTRPILVIGLALLLLGYYAISGLDTDTTLTGYLLRLLPMGLGMGSFQSPNNSAVMGSAPRAQLGVASGLLSLTRTLGQTAGIAILGAVWAGQVDMC